MGDPVLSVHPMGQLQGTDPEQGALGMCSWGKKMFSLEIPAPSCFSTPGRDRLHEPQLICCLPWPQRRHFEPPSLG